MTITDKIWTIYVSVNKITIYHYTKVLNTYLILKLNLLTWNKFYV